MFHFNASLSKWFGGQLRVLTTMHVGAHDLLVTSGRASSGYSGRTDEGEARP